MKFNLVEQTEAVESFICIACDIAKKKLDFYTKLTINGKLNEIDGQVSNSEHKIKEMLLQIQALAKANGITKVIVACEPTGGYEKKLLRIAFNLNLCPSYVHSGHSKNASRITSNDTEKTDPKDCRSIYLVAADLKKTIPYQPLSGDYEQLRSLNNWYKEVNDRIVQLRCQVHHQMKELFSEFSRDNDYISGNVGRAIFQVCGYDPRVIVKLGKSGFFNKIKRINKHTKRNTIDCIYAEAKANLNLKQSDISLDILASRFKHTYEIWLSEVDQKEVIGNSLEETYQRTIEYKKLHEFESFTDRQMARIIGETGPLNNFTCQEQIVRYAGLNLCRRQSGNYVGKTKISKCGRVLLRYVLYQSVWSSLHRKKSELATYYKKKKSEGQLHGKAMVGCMRKSIKIIFGAFCSADGYNQEMLDLYLENAS